MKALLFIGFIIFFGWLGSSNGKNEISSSAHTNLVRVANDTIDFSTQVLPIMIKNCSPCHFTGGKMYDQLPFDKDTTIINHSAGILKRIKGEEKALIKVFVEQTQ